MPVAPVIPKTIPIISPKTFPEPNPNYFPGEKWCPTQIKRIIEE